MSKHKSSKIKGLTPKQVSERKSAGLSNRATDSVSPSYAWIILRNTFNLINVFLFPLMGLLVYFEKYKEVFVILTFSIVNSLVSMWDEIRFKRRLDQIQTEFGKKVKVIRSGKEQEIDASAVVIDDVIKVGEGEGILTDGEILLAKHLQVDESLLTGESDYIAKESGERVLAGSFVVTGECLYKVSGVGEDNYVNVLGAQSKSFRKERSNLQKIGDSLTIFFVLAAIIFGIAAFVSSRSIGLPNSEAVLPLVSVVALIVPQTLIFLFTFTFSISVLKLSNLGVLVQRGSAIESLANLDVLCFDKTGTITTNTMQAVKGKYWGTTAEEVAGYFNYAKDKVFGKNKTFDALADFFAAYGSLRAKAFEQEPFNSKTKSAVNRFTTTDGVRIEFMYGAVVSISEYIRKPLVDEIQRYVESEEKRGHRVIVGVVIKQDASNIQKTKTSEVWAISLKEELNEGIKEILDRFAELGTELKIISGDSYLSVTRVLGAAGIKLPKVVDLSKYDGDIALAAMEYDVFTRARPEDKLNIINSLKSRGKQVGMVGDGVNDVLALKLSNLSIAMESGSKMARDVADIVLLGNDFSLVPQVLFEAENIIANLKYMNKLFLSKTFHAMVLVAIAIVTGFIFPLFPASILIYGFLGSSLPSYVTAFWRRKITSGGEFWQEVMPFSVISAIVSAVGSWFVFELYRHEEPIYTNTAVMYGALILSALYAMYLLWTSGYLQRWYEPIVAFLAIAFGSMIPVFIPILNLFYDIVPMRFETWQNLFLVAGVSFLFYLALQRLYDLFFQSTSDR